MTRAAAVTGWLVALVALLRTGLHPGGGPWETVAEVAAAGVLAAAWLTWRRRLGGQLALAVLTLFLCVRYLAIYSQVNNIWPALTIILLASITFGLTLLGLLLDRFHPPSPGGGGRL